MCEVGHDALETSTALARAMHVAGLGASSRRRAAGWDWLATSSTEFDIFFSASSASRTIMADNAPNPDALGALDDHQNQLCSTCYRLLAMEAGAITGAPSQSYSSNYPTLRSQ